MEYFLFENSNLLLCGQSKYKSLAEKLLSESDKMQAKDY